MVARNKHHASVLFSVISFRSCISDHLQHKVEDYIQVFEPYRETYKTNNEHMTKVKEAYTNSSLEEFHNDVEKYKGMTEDFETIPARATVRTSRPKRIKKRASNKQLDIFHTRSQ